MISLLFDDESSPFALKPTAWEPVAVLGTDLEEWWSAEDHGTANMTDDGAGLISAWVGRKGAVTVTAATTARPTYGATAFGGTKKGLTFDGTTDAMVSTSFAGLPGGATAGELWAVVSQDQLDAVATVGTMVDYGGTNAGTDRCLFRSRTASISAGFINDGTDSLGFSQVTVPFNGTHIIRGFWSGTTQGISLDGNTQVTETIAAFNTGSTRLRIGASNASSATNFLLGVVRHVLVTSILTAARRQQLEGWLAWDSGIQAKLPVAHPFRLSPP